MTTKAATAPADKRVEVETTITYVGAWCVRACLPLHDSGLWAIASGGLNLPTALISPCAGTC
jgi:hypothetical protein